MSNAESGEQAATLAMASGKLDRIRSYLERGRRFSTLEPEELKALYADKLASTLSTFPHRSSEFDDIQAEYDLRGEPIPDGEPGQFEELMRKMVELIDAMDGDKLHAIEKQMQVEARTARGQQN